MTVRETGLYYLQSRYYNPTWGRFLNADVLVATGQGMLGNNMFAYCNNNPVRYLDSRGDEPIDPSGDLGGYVGSLLADLFWDLLEEDEEDTLYEVGSVVCNNFELSLGLGIGLFLGFEIEEFFLWMQDYIMIFFMLSIQMENGKPVNTDTKELVLQFCFFQLLTNPLNNID